MTDQEKQIWNEAVIEFMEWKADVLGFEELKDQECLRALFEHSDWDPEVFLEVVAAGKQRKRAYDTTICPYCFAYKGPDCKNCRICVFGEKYGRCHRSDSFYYRAKSKRQIDDYKPGNFADFIGVEKIMQKAVELIKKAKQRVAELEAA